MTKLIVLLVVHQFSASDGKILDTGYVENFSSPKLCLEFIKSRVMPGTSVQSFRRYKISSSEESVRSKELECVVF